MSMRLQLNLLVAALIAVFTVVLFGFQVFDTRRSVREETMAANRVANHLLSYIVEIHAAPSSAALGQSLDRLGRVRSTEISLVDGSGRSLHRSPPSPYKAGRNAPRWYAALVEPPPMRRIIQLPDGTLEIHANASRSILDGWDHAVALLQVALAALVLANLLVFWAVRRVTQPLQTIVRGLEQMQGGAYHTRLPTFATAEAAAISRAFNAAAAAVEENLEARRKAAEAELRLEQSRELADAVQRRVEEDRRLIAQELHDEAGQGITAIRSMALAMKHGAGNSQQGEAAQLIADTAGRLYGVTHDLIARLRPPSLDERDLPAAIGDLLAMSQRQHPGIEFSLRTAPGLPSPGERVALAAYRIIQEAITNVLRHAAASRVEVMLDQHEGQLLVELRDDGRGLAPDWQRGDRFGVRGMRERAHALGGELEVANAAGGGVLVRALLPLEPRA